jgi:hypothetical protein
MKSVVLFSGGILLSLLCLSLSISNTDNTSNNEECQWGTPSLRNCELRSWRGTAYTIYPICPKCGRTGSTGQSGGIRRPYRKNDSETIKTSGSCSNKGCPPSGSNWYRFEYGFTVTSICH